MQGSKAAIISRLQKEILLMQGFRQPAIGENEAILQSIRQAFPNATFPLGAIHEFFCEAEEEVSASSGFISAIISSLMKKNGPSVWISSSPTLFPPALLAFGINPSRIIFLHLKKEKERLWAMEEVLKCDAITSVIGEINEISLTQSRRMQLAVEQSRVTGFILRFQPKNLSTTSVARWKIKPAPTPSTDLPGPGFPTWEVALLKIRNGKPGTWQMEWKNQQIQLIHQPVVIAASGQRKIV